MSDKPEYGDAYQGAREDLSIWKRRALEAEAKVREQSVIIDRLGDALNADHGPAFMGEPKLITTPHENGDLIAAQATIANQTQMIEHLRGGLTTPTSIDVANADADGYRNGFAAAIKSLPEQQHFTNWAAYTEWRAAQIEAVGDFGGEVKP
ncbi:hypothetical protein [Pseudomonas sp. GM67]|uniref:hypothetical protein n=1 Tax=Pseudomonas sp. GM67 TaxID=1144335 RepID=UPI000270C38E|nr:hypothetical protein [Pseudomonas sp. GM67]EJM92476.1 hypothetical protein PMI33_00733 [Pseudomonas sp. GM67]